MFVRLALTVIPLGVLAWVMFNFVGTRWGVAFIIFAVVFLCLFWSHKRARSARPIGLVQESARPNTSTEAVTTQAPIAALLREPIVTHGPRASTIADLPVYVYEKSGGNRSEECSVCLGEIQRGEIVKQLPICMHLFHEGCIDMWLSSHATCPICRYRVDTDAPAEVTVRIQS